MKKDFELWFYIAILFIIFIIVNTIRAISIININPTLTFGKAFLIGWFLS